MRPEPAPHDRVRAGTATSPLVPGRLWATRAWREPGRLQNILLATTSADPTAAGQTLITIISVVIVVINSDTAGTRCKSSGLLSPRISPRRSLPGRRICEEAIYPDTEQGRRAPLSRTAALHCAHVPAARPPARPETPPRRNAWPSFVKIGN